MRSHLLLAASLLALPRMAAAEGTVRAEVDSRKIGVKDQLQLTITVEGSGFRLLEDVTLPRLQNLRAVGGPSLSTQVSFVNGASSQSRVSTWLLQPLSPGKAEIGPARARFEDGDKTTEPITVDVVAGRLLPPREPARDPFGEDPFESFFGTRRGRVREPKLFVEAAVSRNRLRVGEPLLLTYWLYLQGVSVSDLRFVDAPQYPGFWAEDLEKPPTPTQGEGANVAGETYRRFPIFVKLLFPTKAGSLTIPPATLHVGLLRQSLFDAGGEVERTTKAVAVTVDPIPEAAGFTGAVGRFKVSASLDKPSLTLGEAATLRFKVEGTGNLKWVDKGPEVAMPGAKVYPPQVKSDFKASASGISGSRTWEFVVVPETAGDLEVPAISFAYFDSAAGRLESAATTALPMRVLGGTAAAGLPLPAPAALPSRPGGPLPLRSDLDLDRTRSPRLGAAALAGALGLAIAAHAALWATGRLGRGSRRGAGGAPRRNVRAALAELERVGKDGLSKEAASTLIERALREAFGPLDEDGAEGEGIEAARSVLEEVQFVRYAPQLGDYSEKLRELAALAAETVKRWA